MANIFVSYAREDKSSALKLYKILEDEAFSPWIDAKDLLPGQDWKMEIDKAIRESSIFIACLSNNSVSKEGFVQAELKSALEVAELKPEGAGYIIPVRLNNCEVPNNLQKWQWVDFFEEGETEKLVKAIQSFIDLPAQKHKQQLMIDTSTKKDFDIETSERVQTERLQFLSRIRKNIASLEANSTLIAEHLYPQIATRKVEAQLRHIRTDTGPDDESYPPSVRANFVQQRIDAFNTILGWEFTEDDHKFIEMIIDNPEILHIWVAFREIENSDGHEELMEYKFVSDFLKHEQDTVNKAKVERYEEMNRLAAKKARSVYKWVVANMPDVTPKDLALWFEDIFRDLQ